jgi:hypothetical protein
MLSSAQGQLYVYLWSRECVLSVLLNNIIGLLLTTKKYKL